MREITIYTAQVCAYCAAAKRLLGQKGLAFREVDLTENPDLRLKLSEENGGYRTVPMIFIGDEFIGGFSELASLDRNGQLDAKIREQDKD